MAHYGHEGQNLNGKGRLSSVTIPQEIKEVRNVEVITLVSV